MTFQTPDSLARLRAALRRPLLGLPVQMRMSPQPRPGTERILDPYLDCKQAAVLALFYPCADDLCLVLTRRTEGVASHQGQVSLPGGSMEPGESPDAAALREAWEELAIDTGQVELLGRLSRLYIPPSNFCIQPVVGYTAERPSFRPAPDEVAEVIEEPLSHLLDANTCRTEVWQLRGQPVNVPFYLIQGHKVWGATAMVLGELVAMVGEAIAESR